MIPFLGGIEDGISTWLCMSPTPGCSRVVAGDWAVTGAQGGGRGVMAPGDSSSREKGANYPGVGNEAP